MDSRAFARAFGPQKPMSSYEKIKVFFFTITLIAPIRLFLVIFFLTMIAILCRLSYELQGRPTAEKPGHLSRFNRWFLVIPSQILGRVCMYVLGVWWIETEGARDPSVKVMVSNHICPMDNCYHFSTTFPAFVAKSEVIDFPFFSHLLKASGSIPVRRTTAEGRAKAARAMITYATDTSFPNMVVYPQGTTTRQSELTTFFRGAFLSGASVQPVGIQYPFTHFDCSDGLHSKNEYYLLRCLCQFRVYMKVKYFNKYTPSKQEKEDPILYAHNVREVISRSLNLPTSDYEYMDVILGDKVQRAGADDPSTILGDFTMRSGRKQFDFFNLDCAKACLTRYARFDKGLAGGKVTIGDFSRVFGWSEGDEEASCVFRSLFNCSGSVCFGDFVVGMCASSEMATTPQAGQHLAELEERWARNGGKGCFQLKKGDCKRRR